MKRKKNRIENETAEGRARVERELRLGEEARTGLRVMGRKRGMNEIAEVRL